MCETHFFCNFFVFATSLLKEKLHKSIQTPYGNCPKLLVAVDRYHGSYFVCAHFCAQLVERNGSLNHMLAMAFKMTPSCATLIAVK